MKFKEIITKEEYEHVDETLITYRVVNPDDVPSNPKIISLQSYIKGTNKLNYEDMVNRYSEDMDYFELERNFVGFDKSYITLSIQYTGIPKSANVAIPEVEYPLSKVVSIPEMLDREDVNIVNVHDTYNCLLIFVIDRGRFGLIKDEIPKELWENPNFVTAIKYFNTNKTIDLTINFRAANKLLAKSAPESKLYEIIHSCLFPGSKASSTDQNYQDIVYFELNDWFAGRDYPNEKPFSDWMGNISGTIGNDEWAKNNKLCIVKSIVDMSQNFCITATKDWVMENCPRLLDPDLSSKFLRHHDEYDDLDDSVYGRFDTPFLEYNEDNFGVSFIPWDDED